MKQFVVLKFRCTDFCVVDEAKSFDNIIAATFCADRVSREIASFNDLKLPQKYAVKIVTVEV